MGLLAKRLNHLEEVTATISSVLAHFDTQELDDDLIKALQDAADLAFTDELLLEKFSLWNELRDDEVFLFHIRRFFEKRNRAPLTLSQRDHTFRRDEIEAEIKAAAREEVKKMFSQRITSLAVKNGLDNNAKLGEFLGVSEEQARKFRSGEHKPHLATLKMLAEKFKVRLEYLSGHSDEELLD